MTFLKRCFSNDDLVMFGPTGEHLMATDRNQLPNFALSTIQPKIQMQTANTYQQISEL